MVKNWLDEQLAIHRKRMSEDPDYAAADARKLEEAAAEEAARERRDRIAARSAMYDRSGVSLRDEVMHSVIRGELADTEALRAVRAWQADRATPWLFLSGRTGSGKTVAAASEVGPGTAWMRADDVVRSFAGFFGDAAEKQEKARTAALLVVDDLGTELDPQRMLPALLELMDSRMSAKTRPTIVTTNLTKKEFADRYANERLNSRMREVATWVSLTSADMRGKIVK